MDCYTVAAAAAVLLLLLLKEDKDFTWPTCLKTKSSHADGGGKGCRTCMSLKLKLRGFSAILEIFRVLLRAGCFFWVFS